MEKEEIEAEIKERVAFKLGEIKTSIINTSKMHYAQSMHSSDPRHRFFNEALNQFAEIIQKEIEMNVPYDMMHEARKRAMRDNVLDEILDRVIIRGQQTPEERRSITRFLVGKLEKLHRGL